MNFRFFLLISALALVEILACPPAQPAASTTNTTAKLARRRRSVESVRLILVTNADFDTSTNEVVYQQVKTVLREFAKTQNIKYNKTQVVETVKNNAGKFAIEYNGNLDCEELKHFVQGVKAQTQEISFVLLNCGSQPLQIL